MMDIDTDHDAPVYTSSPLPRNISPGYDSRSRKRYLRAKYRQADQGTDEESLGSVDTEMTDCPLVDSLQDDSPRAIQAANIEIDMTDAFAKYDDTTPELEDIEQLEEKPESRPDPSSTDTEILHLPEPEPFTRFEQARTLSTLEEEVISLLDINKIHSITLKDGRLKIRF